MQPTRAPSESTSFSPSITRVIDYSSAKETLQIWKDIFGFDDIDENSNFFDLGGSSLTAGRLQAKLKEKFGIAIGTADIVRNPTLAGITEKVESILGRVRREEVVTSSQNVIPLQPRGNGRPLFVISQSMIFRNFALHLGTSQPVYTIVMNEGDPVSNLSSFEEIIDFHLQWIRAVQPNGPYRLAGWCVSGWIAYGIARKLETLGEEIELLMAIDVVAPGYWAQCKWPTKLRYSWHRFNCARKATSTTQLILKRFLKTEKSQEEKMGDVLDQTASQAQFLGPLKGKMLLFFSVEDSISVLPRDLGWEHILGRSIQSISLPGDHHKIFENPGAKIMAHKVLEELGERQYQKDFNADNPSYTLGIEEELALR